MKKKLLAVLMAVCMLFAFSSVAFAGEGLDGEENTPAQTEDENKSGQDISEQDDQNKDQSKQDASDDDDLNSGNNAQTENPDTPGGQDPSGGVNGPEDGGNTDPQPGGDPSEDENGEEPPAGEGGDGENIVTEPETKSENGFTVDKYGVLTAFDPAEYGSANVVIPSEVGGIEVKSIGGKSFTDCKTIASVVIPDSVTSINGVFGTQFGAFSGCSNLKSVTIPDSVTSIGVYVFKDCTSLSQITIPDSVTSIGWGTFAGCRGLKSVKLSDSLTMIDEGLFTDCVALTSIAIPSSVTNIRTAAFRGCSALTNISLSDGITRIPAGIGGLTGLKTITIPASVTAMSIGTFYGCTSLESIKFEGNAPEVDYSYYDEDYPLGGGTLGPEYTTFYKPGATGFTNPWCGYPAVEIGSGVIATAGDEVKLFGDFAAGTALKTQDITSEEVKQEFESAITPKEKILWWKDVSLSKDDQDVHTAKSVTLAIKIDSKYNGKTLKVLHIQDGGTMETVNGNVDNGYIYFTIHGLSPIAIVETVETAPAAGTVEQTPETPTAVDEAVDNAVLNDWTAVAQNGTGAAVTLTSVNRSPKTSDDTNALPYIFLIAAAGALLGGRLIYRRRIRAKR